MKINEITLNNFKGSNHDEVVPLSGFDILTGPNGSGKTRVLQAVQLALLGNVPKHDEDTNVEIDKLFSRQSGSNVMAVGMRCDGIDFSRSFEIDDSKGKPSVSESVEIDPPIKGGLREAKAKIKEIAGTFTPMLNIQEFTRLSDAKRSDMIFQFASIDAMKWSTSVVISEIESLIRTTFNLTDEELGELRSPAKHLTSADVRWNIDFLTEKFGKRASELRSLVKGSKEGAQAAMKLSHSSTVQSRPSAEVKAECDKITQKHLTAVKSLERAKAQSGETGRDQERRRGLESKIKLLVGAKDQILPLVEEIKKLEAPCDVCASSGEAHKATVTQYIEAEAKVDKARNDVRQIDDKIIRLESEIKMLEGGECPTCHQTVKPIAMTALKSELDGLFMVKDDLNGRVLVAVSNASELHDAIEKHKAVEDDHSRRHKLAIAEAVEKRNKLHVVERDAAMCIEYRNELMSLEERLGKSSGSKSGSDISELKLQVDSMAEKISKLDEEFRASVSSESAMIRAKDFAAASKKAERLLEIVLSMLDKVKRIKQQIVAEALEPIRADVEEIFDAFGVKAIFCFSLTDARGNEVFSFGWRVIDNNGFEMYIDFDSLSTAQQLLTIVGLLAPLISRANPTLRVMLLDNCEVVDKWSIKNFLKAMNVAKSKHLDNLIMASSSSMSCESARVHVFPQVEEPVAA